VEQRGQQSIILEQRGNMAPFAGKRFAKTTSNKINIPGALHLSVFLTFSCYKYYRCAAPEYKSGANRHTPFKFNPNVGLYEKPR